MSDDILYKLPVSQARRWVGVGSFAIVGVLLPTVVVVSPATLVWNILLLAYAAFCLWQAYRMHLAGQRSLILYEDRLTLDDGELIAPLSEVVSIDRSLFAYKPSGGFILKLREKSPRGGVMGLYSRRGRRIAVGGIVSSVGGRGMADMIQALLLQRDGEL